ncbi:exopolysaccharide biosynthesis polyprenyl glycosylphosphotransferase [Microlunatus panaciterrae]|uniref:Exopolysaccharide biosynthesis polyprenyl glycosylphosphotransferase n=1 Tax=Microlunatus panaciterrae TaxID=400768 RepID=A0ABS2RHP8_9ACTN|nr:sugar transferase [Microlunatus panaciterrae]MBM7798482.1 exopolysaccharide biosynthesis polyprenyl glycosylphosphotransferase [Microlunatus panaciterrae]
MDALVGMVAVALAAARLPDHSVQANAVAVLVLILAGTLVWPLVVASARGYERRRVGIGGDEMRAVLRAAVSVVVLGAFPAGILERTGLLTLVVTAVPIATVASIGVRYVSRRRLHRRQRDGRDVRSVVVVGSPFAAANLCESLALESTSGMRVIGVCAPAAELARARELGLNVIGDLDHVAAVVREFNCDAVAVTSGDATRHNYLRQLAWSLEGAGVELLVSPGLVEVAGPRMHIRPYVGLPLLHIEQPHFTGWRRIIKRAADLVLTGFGLLLIGPVLGAIALAIKLNDGGPVFFRQTRVGLGGEEFSMLKFRSMAVDAEQRLADLLAQNEGAGPLFKMKNDPRITRVGRLLRRYSLDELPQLFNVLSGSMSLVGPRPPLQSEVAGYANDAKRRLLVTPGVTGLWQVSGRSELSWEESVRLDLRYVENWSLTFDLLILWKTAFAVVRAQGAY